MTMLWTSTKSSNVTIDMVREFATLLPTPTRLVARPDITEQAIRAEDPTVSVALLGGLPEAMVKAYAKAAVRHACFDLLESGEVFGSVSGLQGVWGEGATVEESRRDLEESIIDWVIVRREQRLDIPPIEGLDLNL